MKHTTIIFDLIAIFVVLAGASTISTAFGKSFCKVSPSVDELWSVMHNYEQTQSLRSYLYANGWVNDDVTWDQLDYILVLACQACEHFENVDPALAISVIAHESRFDTNAKNGSARGLMQIIPRYHYDRLRTYVDDDIELTSDMFFDERLCIMTGLDYLNDILDQTNRQTHYALMWYNQGANSASSDYIGKGHISQYSESVYNLASEIDVLVGGDYSRCFE